MKVIVCQHGARHRYAIPKMLESQGLLKALYTDSCEFSTLGIIAKIFEKYTKGRLARLANRKIEGIPKNKVYTSDLCTIKELISVQSKDMAYNFNKVNSKLLSKLKQWGINNSDVFYSFNGENLEYLKEIKGKTKIVVDVCISPLTQRILLNEYINAKEVFSFNISEWKKYTLFREQHFKKVAEVADVLLSPSEWVANGIIDLCSHVEDKIRICPYGTSIENDNLPSTPVPGRIFWAGSDWGRKGLHYLAMAADDLVDKYPEMCFRVAGITDMQLQRQSYFKNITFLGKIGKNQMINEFKKADMFVLPSLSEGMASVVVEAIAMGCPVVITKATGIDHIQNEINGLVINPTVLEIKESILKIFKDRAFRDSLVANSRNIAQLYSIQSWSERLIDILLKS